MRKRKELDELIENSGKIDRITLEVLLDIRELLVSLSEKKK